jgi:L-iditol 2-dehydrogenase
MSRGHCLEATGNPSALETACRIAKKRGKIVLVGIFHRNISHVHPEHSTRKELRVFGSICYNRADFLECIDLVATGKVCTNPVITNTLLLSEIELVLDMIRNRQAIKVALDPNRSQRALVPLRELSHAGHSLKRMRAVGLTSTR